MAFTRLDLENKIKELFDLDVISSLIDNQITKFVREQRYSYLDIARALYYWVIEREGVLDKRGIGIVPYIMADAKAWFAAQEQLHKQQEAESEKLQNIRIVKVRKPQKRNRIDNTIDIRSIKEDD